MNLFSLLIGLGASLGLIRVLQGCPAATRLRHLTAGLLSLAGGLLGARIGFVAAYHSYFAAHPAAIFRIDLGGLSWPGALAGTLLFAWISLKIVGLSILEGFDRLSRLLLPLASFLWLGAWIWGSAYGQPLPAGTWWGMQIPDETGFSALRVPVQPAAILSLLVLLGLLEWLLRAVRKKGIKATSLALALSLHTLVFSFMRYDSSQRMAGLRLDTWAAILFSLLFSTLLMQLLVKSKPRQIAVTE